MQFNEALSYLQTTIGTLSSDEIDPIILRAMFEDVVVERASEYFEDVGEEVLPDSADWAKMEEILQSKISDYSQFIQNAADAFLAEYRADID